MKLKFNPTKLQIDEMLNYTHVRLDTITEDPDSADHFETEESLNILFDKIINGNFDFTDEEVDFMIQETKTRINIGEANANYQGIEEQGYVNSMNNLLTKLNKIKNGN